jgi:hypothetical protein
MSNNKMDFLEAVLIVKTNLSMDAIDRAFEPDIATALKTIVSGLDDEMRKARQNGYAHGYIAAEREKDKVIEKLVNALESQKMLEDIEPEDFDKERLGSNLEAKASPFKPNSPKQAHSGSLDP